MICILFLRLGGFLYVFLPFNRTELLHAKSVTCVLCVCSFGLVWSEHVWSDVQCFDDDKHLQKHRQGAYIGWRRRLRLCRALLSHTSYCVSVACIMMTTWRWGALRARAVFARDLLFATRARHSLLCWCSTYKQTWSSKTFGRVSAYSHCKECVVFVFFFKCECWMYMAKLEVPFFGFGLALLS